MRCRGSFSNGRRFAKVNDKRNQMTSFYDDKVHAHELAEELSQVNCQDDLEFAYLFEYEPPSSDFPVENRGLLCLSEL